MSKKVEADGSLRVEVFEFIGEAAPRMGEVIVTETKDGFEVKSWPKAMKSPDDMPSPEPSVPPRGGGTVVCRARLGAADHFKLCGRAGRTVAKARVMKKAGPIGDFGRPRRAAGQSPARQFLRGLAKLSGARPLSKARLWWRSG